MQTTSNVTDGSDNEESDLNLVSIAAAADAIFATTGATFTTDSGVVVHIAKAKTRQLRYAVNFIEMLAGSMDSSQFFNMVQAFASAQREAIAQGLDPESINTAEVARAALGNASLLLTIASRVTGELPALVALFTNLTAEQVDELSADELVLVVCQIFLVNYAFFTQTLRPILLSFVAALLRRAETARVA